MKRRLLICTCLTIAAAMTWPRDSPVLAPHMAIAPQSFPGAAAAQDFRPLPFHKLAKRVSERYRGRLIGVNIMRPTPRERDLGAALIYEFRIITPQQNLLRIRMDARDGRFLDVAGRGQLEALKPVGKPLNNESKN
ncbi:hypothetical protein PAF17_10275 [Paracoccus sp. Z330]|uniref:PepSY domain-containing protein n=1 Tax=Paracoccus onchidii TaxID=3017813 RepID=A0ABT4ZFL1_9RHOB|nr:hypothetical protein [Paracoccus onchidii]MDB6177887.1 hypothetical protein [Paracoccus onchidii]